MAWWDQVGGNSVSLSFSLSLLISSQVLLPNSMSYGKNWLIVTFIVLVAVIPIAIVIVVVIHRDASALRAASLSSQTRQRKLSLSTCKTYFTRRKIYFVKKNALMVFNMHAI